MVFEHTYIRNIERYIYAPARSPFVGNARGVGVHCLLNILSIVVFLCVILGARVIAEGGPAMDECVLEPAALVSI